MGHPGSLPVRVNLSEAEVFCTPKQVVGMLCCFVPRACLASASVGPFEGGMLPSMWGMKQQPGLEAVLHRAALNPSSWQREGLCLSACLSVLHTQSHAVLAVGGGRVGAAGMDTCGPPFKHLGKLSCDPCSR